MCSKSLRVTYYATGCTHGNLYIFSKHVIKCYRVEAASISKISLKLLSTLCLCNFYCPENNTLTYTCVVR